MKQDVKTWLAEFTGTYALIFFGCGSIVINDTHGGPLGHLGISIVFGLIILVMIKTYGELSGAHFNPAVSIAFWLAGLFPLRKVPAYILSQSLGAIAAGYTLLLFYPGHETLGATYAKTGDWLPAFAMEFILSFFLMLVILHVATGSKLQRSFAALAIGMTVLLEAAVGGPLSGASMNPARSIGPALAAGFYTDLWIYIAAPVLGAAFSILFWKITKHQES